jgi:hypothetical protein
VPPNVVEQGHALDVEFTDEAMNRASRALDNIASVDPASPKLDDIARNAHDILALISPERVCPRARFDEVEEELELPLALGYLFTA